HSTGCTRSWPERTTASARRTHSAGKSALPHADTGPIRQRDLAVHDGRAVEAVVANQDAAVEIGPVDQRGELRRSGNGARGLGHAAEHRLQTEGAREDDHL